MELREPSVQQLDIWKGIGQSVEVLERSGVRSCENYKVGWGWGLKLAPMFLGNHIRAETGILGIRWELGC